jgi:hypothetical protein
MKRAITTTTENTDPTTLQERLEGLTSSIGKVGVAVAVLVFAVLTGRHFTGSTTDEQGNPLFDKRHVTFDTVLSAIVAVFHQPRHHGQHGTQVEEGHLLNREEVSRSIGRHWKVSIVLNCPRIS